MKKKAVKKANSENVLKHFFAGIVIFIIIQAIFMVGGLFIEKAQGGLITGVPSALGLTLLFLSGFYFSSKGKEFVFLGMSVLSFLVPLILFLISLFSASDVSMHALNYSLIYTTLLVIVINLYLVIKIIKEGK